MFIHKHLIPLKSPIFNKYHRNYTTKELMKKITTTHSTHCPNLINVLKTFVNNNYHDVNDFPNVGQALLPLTQNFKDELKINSLRLGADYEFSPRKHFQFELLQLSNNGKHNIDNSVYGGYIENKGKLSLSYIKFAQPFSRDRFNFKASMFFQNYGVKNLENINEVGLGLGVGFNFGITGNQIDFGYKYANRSGVFVVKDETLHMFNISISIGDLWFVKRREI